MGEEKEVAWGLILTLTVRWSSSEPEPKELSEDKDAASERSDDPESELNMPLL